MTWKISPKVLNLPHLGLCFQQESVRSQQRGLKRWALTFPGKGCDKRHQTMRKVWTCSEANFQLMVQTSGFPGLAPLTGAQLEGGSELCLQGLLRNPCQETTNKTSRFPPPQAAGALRSA